MTIKARALLLAILFWAIPAGHAWAGRAVLDSYPSTILNRRVSFSVYLPDRYDAATHQFPALYLLHGLDGDQNEWLENGALETVNALMAKRELRPMLSIMPSFGEQSWWVDGEQDKAESALIRELIPYVEGKYKVLQDRRGRALAGWSMGAYGALNLALRHPDFFCAAAVISPEIYQPLPAATSGIRRMPQFMRHGVFDPAVWQSLNYPAHLQAYRDNPRRVPIWIATGDDDQLLGLVPMATRLYGELAAIQPEKVELRVIDGELDWATVRRALPDALRYLERQCLPDQRR
ncbi:esterase family protein|uniref:alpha/beta hydrolase n=1 Tax=Noviherbaspirillum sp. L7-7A TaxID=2850560 RepID=UPI001C2C5C2B|nr:alpha/beta hydrolase-fold protein [Noviherbaspirillum sp. L7-7A]MBV0878191.1 esterase family protein [Noviherbaspirillum sp. L7-7A]